MSALHTLQPHLPTALVVIDMQRDFCSPGGYAEHAGMDMARMQPVIAQVQALLAAARQAGVMVVHTREGHLSDLSDCPSAKQARSVAAGAPIGSMGPLGRLLVRGEHGHDFVDALQPWSSEVVIDKPGYGAFHRTALGETLQRAGVQQLIVCGVTTEVCVHSTVREATDRGLRCVTVGDATAATDPSLQAAALAMLGVEGGIFGGVADTAACVHWLRALPPAVPAALRGLWRRTLLDSPDGRDTTTLVYWLQTERWHADVRIPAGVDPASQAGRAQLQGFCGITQVTAGAPGQPDVCTWHRLWDVQPPAARPDAGYLVFEGPDRLIETGVHSPYLEVWERVPGTGHGPFSVALAPPLGLGLCGGDARPSRFTAGRASMTVRPRSAPWPSDVQPGEALREVVGRHPELAAALLDFELSLEVRDGD